MQPEGASGVPLRQGRSSSDGELLDACRAGDTDAFATLWDRHRGAALTAARGLGPGLDADDLVSEAYLKIFELVVDGRGPHGAFRPYLYQVIRTVAVDRYRSPERASAELDQIPDLHEAGPWEDNAFDLNAASEAFASLDERWQAALWYTEVERLPPRQAAPLLGLTANAAAALAVRARDALRSAWVEAHVNRELAEAECRSTLERLQRYQRGKLTARATREVEAHLDRCESCAAVAAESTVLNRQLGLILAGVLLGGGGAAALFSKLGIAAQAGAATAIAAGAGASASTGAAGSSAGAGAGAGGGASAGAIAIVTGAVVAAAAVVGVAAVAISGLSGPGPAGTGEPGGAIAAPNESAPPSEPTASNPEPASRSKPAEDPRDGNVDPDPDPRPDPPRPDPPKPDPPKPDPPKPDPPKPDPPKPDPPKPDPPDPDPPKTGLDPSLDAGYYCYMPGGGSFGIEGSSNEYGVLRMRAWNGTIPVELVQPVFDPALEGIEPGNPFVDGIYTDPLDHTFDFGFFTDMYTTPPYYWWGPGIESLPAWNAAFPGLVAGDVTIQLRLVTPDGRYSPWSTIDTGVVC